MNLQCKSVKNYVPFSWSISKAKKSAMKEGQVILLKTIICENTLCDSIMYLQKCLGSSWIVFVAHEDKLPANFN